MENVALIKNPGKNLAVTVTQDGMLLNIFHINQERLNQPVRLTQKQYDQVKAIGLDVDGFISHNDIVGLEEGIIGYITSVTDNVGKVSIEGTKYEQLLDDIY